MPDPNSAASILCEPACAVEMHMDISQEPFCVEIYDENTSIKHRALTLTIRTPQCGYTVWRKCNCCKPAIENKQRKVNQSSPLPHVSCKNARTIFFTRIDRHATSTSKSQLPCADIVLQEDSHSGYATMHACIRIHMYV